MQVGAIIYHRLQAWQDRRRGLQHHPPMVVLLWVERIDPGTTPMRLYIIPHQDIHPLLHDPATNLMTAAQYALSSLHKAGVGALLPLLQANPRPVGTAFL